jgi:hypothetical protein
VAQPSSRSTASTATKGLAAHADDRARCILVSSADLDVVDQFRAIHVHRILQRFVRLQPCLLREIERLDIVQVLGDGRVRGGVGLLNDDGRGSSALDDVRLGIDELTLLVLDRPLLGLARNLR